ncbi:hypothetical protein [Paenibacillus odorifer]|uniref:hypothetical protein n=1 Tax=Paenibacillus odorifer TaxID=189426 RepID=UPI00096ECB74|nr:hypothetical protein [Paenibacillus odorifer]OMD09840.1 hypothetical protein BJP50_29345 [Paenibacillus odorifer]
MERFKAGDIVKAKMAYLDHGVPKSDYKYFLIVSKKKEAADPDQDYSAYQITKVERPTKYDMEFDQININLPLRSFIRTNKQHSIHPSSIVGFNRNHNRKGVLIGTVTKEDLRKARRLHDSEQESIPVTMKVKHKHKKKKKNQTIQEIMDELFLIGLK